jgi:hypothetical protein
LETETKSKTVLIYLPFFVGNGGWGGEDVAGMHVVEAMIVAKTMAMVDQKQSDLERDKNSKL